jgi:tRNA (cytidine/uridine-2'-O-)-methyltransferase
MDYWRRLSLVLHESLDDFLESVPVADCVFASKKAPRAYTEPDYRTCSYLLFGKESAGLPEELLSRVRDRSVRIPMVVNNRSLNLSSAAAVVLYEALRQRGFPGLVRSWDGST